MATRNAVLVTLAKNLRHACQNIITENQKDLDSILKDDPKYDRLLLSKERMTAMANDVEAIASMPFTDRVLSKKYIDPMACISKNALCP